MLCLSFIKLLDKVVSKSKMDWCDIRVYRKGNLYVYDLENGYKMSFEKAVGQIYEGSCDLQNLGFSKAEENQFYTCCKCVIGG